MIRHACIVCTEPATVDIIDTTGGRTHVAWSACNDHVQTSFDYVRDQQTATR